MRSFLSKLRFVAHACFLFLVAQTAAVAAEVTWDGSSNMNWTQPDTTSWSGSTYQSGDIALFAGAGAGTVTLSGTITPGGVIVSSGTYTNNGSGIGGSGGLTVSGGMLILNNNASTYSGTTAVSNGATLQMNLDNLLPFGAGKGNVTVDGLLNLNDRTVTINGLNGAGEVRQPGGNSRVLTLGSGDASGTFSGVIRQTAGTLGVTKTGSGTQTLSGTNRYNGVTTVSAGSLVFSNTNTLSGAIVVNAGALSFTAGNTLSGAITVNAGTLSLGGSNTLSGMVTVNTGGTFRVNHAQALGQTPRLTLAGGATCDTADLDAPYALGNTQTLRLSGKGVAATLQTGADDGLSLASGCALQFTAYNGATAPLAVTGGGSLTFAPSNTVTVTVASASPLAVGDYTLIDGGVAGTAPTTYVTVNGAGRVAATTASLLIAAGDLVLRIEAYVPSHTPGSISSAVNGPWDVATTWQGGVVPGPGDSVTVSHAVTLGNGTHPLSSFVNNGTLTFAGWNAALKATTITLGGTVTHLVNSDESGTVGVYSSWTPDNRILIEGHDITVSGTVNADNKGYMGTSSSSAPRGPGAVTDGQHGAGHGGRGATSGAYSLGGITYGSATAPTDPGSGAGSGAGGNGGNGGGVVRIIATGRVTVNGTVTANGQRGSGSWGGRGSGGSVYITCETFAGTGTVRADGGEQNGEQHAGGGGGRVAVVYDTTAQAAVSPQPTVTLSAKGGLGRYLSRSFMGDPGTVHVSDARFFPPATVSNGFVPVIAGFTSWSPESFTINNTWVKLPDGFTLSPTNTLTVNGAVARLDVSSNAVIRCANVSVTNSAHLWLYAAATNGVAPDYGVKLEVADTLAIANGAAIYPVSHAVNGGSPLILARNVTVQSGGSITADGLGFGPRQGPGSLTMLPIGRRACGGGYGGHGGQSSQYTDHGATYGSREAPLLPGSGGHDGAYGNSPGAGGGLIRIEAEKAVTVNGTLSARGTNPGSNHSGAGSGGAIFIQCGTIGGTGTMAVQGGNWTGETGNGGGGGRISVWFRKDLFGGTTNAAAGTAAAPSRTYNPQPGTVYWYKLPAPGTVLLLR